MRKPKNKLLTNAAERAREKHMYRLMERYTKRIYEPNTWVLPYVWDIEYIEYIDAIYQVHTTEHVCNTFNAAFAAMIFEAAMLPKEIKILRISICGYQQEFNNIVNPKHDHKH